MKNQVAFDAIPSPKSNQSPTCRQIMMAAKRTPMPARESSLLDRTARQPKPATMSTKPSSPTMPDSTAAREKELCAAMTDAEIRVGGKYFPILAGYDPGPCPRSGSSMSSAGVFRSNTIRASETASNSLRVSWKMRSCQRSDHVNCSDEHTAKSNGDDRYKRAKSSRHCKPNDRQTNGCFNQHLAPQRQHRKHRQICRQGQQHRPLPFPRDTRVKDSAYPDRQ